MLENANLNLITGYLHRQTMDEEHSIKKGEEGLYSSKISMSKDKNVNIPN